MEAMQRVDPQAECVSAGQDLALFEHWVQVFSLGEFDSAEVVSYLYLDDCPACLRWLSLLPEDRSPSTSLLWMVHLGSAGKVKSTAAVSLCRTSDLMTGRRFSAARYLEERRCAVQLDSGVIARGPTVFSS